MSRTYYINPDFYFKEKLNEKQKGRLRSYDQKVREKCHNVLHPFTGKPVQSAKDYIDALESQEKGVCILTQDEVTADDIDQRIRAICAGIKHPYYNRPIDDFLEYFSALEYQWRSNEEKGENGEAEEKTTEVKNTNNGTSATPPLNNTAQDKLYSLIGLESLKKDVQELIDFVKMQKKREAAGLRTVSMSLHLVFTGNPGTGKTTVARILAEIYKEIGVLSKGQLVEVDRSGLVAGYVGQTAILTQKKIEEAKGGILFIDEAYTLVKEGTDFGQEAIDTILKAMEDNRDDFIVIVAGYPELMRKFINSNPGLKSRFNKYFCFPDYSAYEMTEIFYSFCNEYDYKLTNQANSLIKQLFDYMEKNKGENFANARDVRNVFERIIGNQSSRVVGLKDASNEDMMQIVEDDVLSVMPKDLLISFDEYDGDESIF